MHELVLENARVDGATVDVAIDAGRISRIGRALGGGAENAVDLGNRLLLPGFVESHIHLDKAFVADRAPGLRPGGPSPQALLAELKRTFTVEDVYARARRALEAAMRHGCVAMRAYVEIDPFVELRGLEAMQALSRDFADLVDLQLVAFAQEGLYHDDTTRGLLVEALRRGVGVLGGCPYMDPGREREHIDWCFKTAAAHGVKLDFHADTADDPAALTCPYIAERTRAHGMQGKVLLGHLCTLDVLSPSERTRAIGALAEAEIHAVSLPATESHVKGRSDPSRTWRGVTRIGELRRGGVVVSVATNNVVNPFTPYGHPDLLRQLLVAAMTAHLGNLEDLAWLPELVTVNAARCIGLDGYGLAVGRAADLVVLDAPDSVSAIVEQAEKWLVVKSGRITVRNRRSSHLEPPALPA